MIKKILFMVAIISLLLFAAGCQTQTISAFPTDDELSIESAADTLPDTSISSVPVEATDFGDTV